MSGIKEKMTRPRRLLRAVMPVTPPPNLRSSLALRRLSPLLLLAAALVALAVLFAPGAQPAKAQAQTTTVWSATLTVSEDNAAAYLGCGPNSGQDRCDTALTSDSFTHGDLTYEIDSLSVYTPTGVLSLEMNRSIPRFMIDNFVLDIDGQRFAFANGDVGTVTNTNDLVEWTNAGLSWADGNSVGLRLTAPSDPTQPTTHWLDTLTVKNLDLGSGITGRGCSFSNNPAGSRCGDSGVLANGNTITYHGANYSIKRVMVAYGGGTLQFTLDREPWDENNSQTEASRLVLMVDDREFAFSDATVTDQLAPGSTVDSPNPTIWWNLHWIGTGLAWNENDAVSLKLVTPPVGGL